MQGEMRKGAAFNYLNLLLVNATGLILTPFIIRCLGPSQYGLYLLAGAILPYLTLLDFGLGKTTTRYAAYYREHNSPGGLRGYMHTVMRLYAGLAVVLLAVGALLYREAPLLWGAHFTADELATLRRAIAVITVTQALIIPGNIFTALCNGCGFFAFPRGLQPVKYMLRAICIAALLVAGEKALALIIADAVLNVGVAIATYFYARKHILQPLHSHPRVKAALRPVLHYAAWIALYQATYAFQWNTGQIVTGITGDTHAVGIAGIGILLGSMYGYFAETINRMLMPHAAHTVGSHLPPAAVTDEMIRISRMVLLPQAFILGGFAAWGAPFVQLWAGDGYGAAYAVALMIMAASTVQLAADYGNTLLEAHGKVRTLSVINFICIFAGAITSYYASRHWGITGMAVALCGGTVAATIAAQIYYRRVLRLATLRYFGAVYPRITAATAAASLLSHLAARAVSLPGNWAGLAGGCVLYALLFVAGIYVFALNEREKKELRQLCSRR